MPVNSPHSEYTANLQKWQRARAVLSGEDAVKDGGVLYLPMLSDQDQDEYNAYKMRASFFNASGRTVDSFVGMIYRKDPDITAPDSLAEFQEDVTLQGQSFYDYTKFIVREIIGLGRSGTLIDWNDAEQRAYVQNYATEQILNWRMKRIGGKTVLGLVVLQETVSADEAILGPLAPDQSAAQAPKTPPDPDVVDHYSVTGPNKPNVSADEFSPDMVDQIRVLKMASDDLVNFYYAVEIWRRRDGQKSDFVLMGRTVPLRKGKALDAIPFVFHGPNNVLPNVDKIPIEDIISINLSHYRTSADLEHGRHWTGLPTPFISGIDSKDKIVLGSTTAITSSEPNARATFLEFNGTGLSALEKAIEQKEHQMSVLGARMLEQPKRASETVEVLQMKQTGEQSSLMQIAATLGESFELILQWALFWEGAADSDFESTQDTVVIELNTDFNMADMDPALVTAIVAAGMSGYLSKDSIVSRFKRADLIPPERTVEDEISLIDSEAPKLNGATLPTNRPPGAPPGAPPTQKPPAKRGKGNAKPK